MAALFLSNISLSMLVLNFNIPFTAYFLNLNPRLEATGGYGEAIWSFAPHLRMKARAWILRLFLYLSGYIPVAFCFHGLSTFPLLDGGQRGTLASSVSFLSRGNVLSRHRMPCPTAFRRISSKPRGLTGLRMSYLNRLLLLSEKQIAVNLQRVGGQV